jgi:hypothetical protein
MAITNAHHHLCGSKGFDTKSQDEVHLDDVKSPPQASVGRTSTLGVANGSPFGSTSAQLGQPASLGSFSGTVFNSAGQNAAAAATDFSAPQGFGIPTAPTFGLQTQQPQQQPQQQTSFSPASTTASRFGSGTTTASAFGENTGFVTATAFGVSPSAFGGSTQSAFGGFGTTNKQETKQPSPSKFGVSDFSHPGNAFKFPSGSDSNQVQSPAANPFPQITGSGSPSTGAFGFAGAAIFGGPQEAKTDSKADAILAETTPIESSISSTVAGAAQKMPPFPSAQNKSGSVDISFGKANQRPSPYVKFCDAKRDEILASNPHATFVEIGRLLADAWGSLSETEKSVIHF